MQLTNLATPTHKADCALGDDDTPMFPLHLQSGLNRGNCTNTKRSL